MEGHPVEVGHNLVYVDRRGTLMSRLVRLSTTAYILARAYPENLSVSID